MRRDGILPMMSPPTVLCHSERSEESAFADKTRHHPNACVFIHQHKVNRKIGHHPKRPRFHQRAEGSRVDKTLRTEPRIDPTFSNFHSFEKLGNVLSLPGFLHF